MVPDGGNGFSEPDIRMAKIAAPRPRHSLLE
jgi:hypothetical protein